MATLKCPECGQVFNEKQDECPNCGYPAYECNADTRFNESPKNEHTAMGSTNQRNVFSKYGRRTTDTGYSNETAIAGYADLVFVCATIGAVILYIAVVIICANIGGKNSSEVAVTVGILGFIVTAIYIALIYIAKAFIKIYANISINLHEINMKLK